jgi:hypothetical protein
VTLEPGSREVQSFFKQPRPEKNPRRSMRRKALNKRTRPVVKWSSDADYEMAKAIVHARSGGVCEHCRDKPATNVHHLAGRGYDGCHHPMLLKDLCGNGSTSGCHKFAHSVSLPTAMALGLRLPWGTRADELGDQS